MRDERSDWSGRMQRWPHTPGSGTVYECASDNPQPMKQDHSLPENSPPPMVPDQSSTGAAETSSQETTLQHISLRVLKAGTLYFALVFGAGAVLGSLRVFWAAPRFGARPAELMEAPIMLLVIVLAAQWIVRRVARTSNPLARLAIGLIGLVLLLCAELLLVVQVRGLSVHDYMTARDPWSAAVYYMMLGAFAVLPMAVARKKHAATPSEMENTD